MAFRKRIPPIKIKLAVKEYNQFIEVLTINCESEIEEFKKRAEELKEKLLRYSIPLEEENGVVEIRFFPNEAQLMMEQFIPLCTSIEAKSDYYALLLDIREVIRQKYHNDKQ